MNRLYINTILTDSFANGPGRRCVVWTQGCSLKCPGCFNQPLIPFYKSASYDVRALAEKLSKLAVDGLTISGGEPLNQNKAIYGFIKAYKRCCDKTILLFTGYSITEIKSSPSMLRTLLLTDAALCGRYIGGHIWQNKQLVVISGRITPADMTPVESVELSVGKGRAILSGYPDFAAKENENEYERFQTRA